MASSGQKNPLAIVLGLSALFFVLFVGFSWLVGAHRHHQRADSAPVFGDSGAVGVLELKGVITDSRRTLKQLDELDEDDQVKAVVLRLDSPGGAVAPSQEIYQRVREFKKPLVVSMSSVAASGAFYIACGAKKVFANPGTITGSIGVIMEFFNAEKLYDWAKVRRYAVKTGKFKDVGAEYRDMRDDERELLQNMVDDVLSQFKKAVSEGRHLSLEKVTSVADGRIFSGSQAREAKLVDELGTLQDAINEAGREAKIKGKPAVVYPRKPKRSILDLVVDERPGRGGDEDSGDDGESSIGGISGWLSRMVARVVGRADPLAGLSPGVYWLWNAH